MKSSTRYAACREHVPCAAQGTGDNEFGVNGKKE
jgi:hypothetical protein